MDTNEKENNHDVGSLETLDTFNKVPDYVQKATDIPTTFFKPIEEVQNQQTEMIEEYHQNQEQAHKVALEEPDLSRNVEILERKLQSKKLYMPLWVVLILVICINGLWFLGVKFLITPKYETYIKQNEELEKSYQTLKRQVEAIIGSD